VDLREQLRPGMSDIYFYKLTADNGGAPCVRHGLLSLAICKPMIRKTAEEGDLTFGFAAN
jgi:Nucleotide modification associated domain 2